LDAATKEVVGQVAKGAKVVTAHLFGRCSYLSSLFGGELELQSRERAFELIFIAAWICDDVTQESQMVFIGEEYMISYLLPSLS
jgi:hypothetical protein